METNSRGPGCDSPRLSKLDELDKNEVLVYYAMYALLNCGMSETCFEDVLRYSKLNKDTQRKALKSMALKGHIGITTGVDEHGHRVANSYYLIISEKIIHMRRISPKPDGQYLQIKPQNRTASIGESLENTNKPPVCGRGSAGAVLSPSTTNVSISPIVTNRDPEPVTTETFDLDPSPTVPAPPSDQSRIDFIVKQWNQIAVEIRIHGIRTLSPKRIKMIRDRLKDFPDSKTWKELFQALRSSPYLHSFPWFGFDYTFRGAEEFEKVLNQSHRWMFDTNRPRNEYRDPNAIGTIFERFGKKDQPK